MARPSFLTDEHIPTAVARGLRARGVDASTAGEVGQLGTADTALLIGGAMLIAEVLTAEEMENRVEFL